MKNTEHRTIWIMYGSMVSALLLYAGIGFFLPGLADSSPDFLKLVTTVFFLSAVLATAVLLLLIPRIGAKKPYQGYCLVRWALAESIGISGMVLTFLGGRKDLFALMLGWSLALMLLCAPTEADRERHELLQKS